MKIIIDRFEGQYAVCEKEDRTMINIEKSKVPIEARPGDVLYVIDDVIVIDEKETKLRKEKMKKLLDSLWE
ncbi:MAG: DUF3006 domain-containing protein [Clostridiaceae bacterium]|nr:DUF3006 domain-containing protein [Clostridiaceae bacterium]